MKRWTIIGIVIATLLVFETDTLWWRSIPVVSEHLLAHVPFARGGAALRVAAVLILVWAIDGRPFSFCGLRANPLIGIGFAIAASAPMWLPLALRTPLANGLDPLVLAFGAGYFPFAEELFYRAFAFGLLHRTARIPFWPAALLTALPFALAHLQQADDPGSAVGTIAVTLLGALLFSWLWKAWGWNFWVPFCLHAAMNLWWSVFEVGEGAFAGWTPLAMQLGCAGLALALTHAAHRRQKKPTGPG